MPRVPQPKTSTKKVDETRRFDKTALTMNNRGHVVHRDYAAHFFRWGFTDNFVIDGKAEVLDIGCGVDCPLAKVMTGNIHYRIKRYVGVDLNKQPKYVPGNYWAEFKWEFDFTSRWKTLGTFNLVTCYEVIEHMDVPDGRRLLTGIRGCMTKDAVALISTPVFNGKAAANHIHEYTIEELNKEIVKAGFKVENRFGTFASVRDIKKVASKEDLKLLIELNKYYTWDVLACFLAPKYPDVSRNNVWVCKLI